MQKDFHFYITYALARKIGICPEDAQKIAWSNQFTDDLTKTDLYGIQTQSAVLGNWQDRQIQFSVLIPFHFVPGDNKDNFWMVTSNSSLAQKLIKASLFNIFRFGIALHSLQDTFSHQGFTGWEEKVNACFDWYYIESTIPNIGHAELRAAPDILSLVWTDPRNGRMIDNKIRAMQAAKVTYDWLIEFHQIGVETEWQEIEPGLGRIFAIANYDKRKEELRKLSGDNTIRDSEITKGLEPDCKDLFINAARKHLSEVMQLLQYDIVSEK